jgi:hypothetical protein
MIGKEEMAGKAGWNWASTHTSLGYTGHMWIAAILQITGQYHVSTGLERVVRRLRHTI